MVSPSIMSDGWSLESRFFQMWTTPASTFPLGSTQSLPVLFQVVKNCIELNILDLMKMRNGCVPVATKGVMLKRKVSPGNGHDFQEEHCSFMFCFSCSSIALRYLLRRDSVLSPLISGECCKCPSKRYVYTTQCTS